MGLFCLEMKRIYRQEGTVAVTPGEQLVGVVSHKIPRSPFLLLSPGDGFNLQSLPDGAMSLVHSIIPDVANISTAPIPVGYGGTGLPFLSAMKLLLVTGNLLSSVGLTINFVLLATPYVHPPGPYPQYTPSQGTCFVVFVVLADGGAGSAYSTAVPCGGGGAGGMSVSTYSIAQLNAMAPIHYNCGPGSTYRGSGQGTIMFSGPRPTIPGEFLTAAPGGHGNFFATGGVGGQGGGVSGTVGQIKIPGNPGCAGNTTTGSGAGGSTFLGAGGSSGEIHGSPPASVAMGYGAGGAGQITTNSALTYGTQGCILVLEFKSL